MMGYNLTNKILNATFTEHMYLLYTYFKRRLRFSRLFVFCLDQISLKYKCKPITWTSWRKIRLDKSWSLL